MLPVVHAVTDERRAAAPDLEVRAGALARGGAALHVRGHTLSGRAHFALAQRFTRLAPGATFVNDRLDVALALPGVGVVLGEASLPVRAARRLLGPARLLGASVHDVAGAARAHADGADFIIFGPVFATESHPGATPQGLERLAEVARIGVPVIAIGGITMERVPLVRMTGAAGVAAIRALWEADQPERTARAMREAWDASVGERSVAGGPG